MVTCAHLITVRVFALLEQVWQIRVTCESPAIVATVCARVAGHYSSFFSLLGWFLSNGLVAIVTIVQHWGHNPPIGSPKAYEGEEPSKGEGFRVSMPPMLAQCPYKG